MTTPEHRLESFVTILWYLGMWQRSH